MHRAPVVVPFRTRLLTDLPVHLPAAEIRARMRVYRPLVVGPATLIRAPSGVWQVRVSADGRLRPLGSPPPAGVGGAGMVGPAEGTDSRTALALVVPADLGTAAADHQPPPGTLRRQPISDMYGWALLYQPRGLDGIALVDPHAEFTDLPAFYESPLEMLDRVTFLARRGIATRPLALVTQPQDFVAGPSGRLHNRFRPHAVCRLPARLDGCE